MSKIYIAAPFKRQAFAANVAKYLVAKGHRVTSRWISATNVELDFHSKAPCLAESHKDLFDIDAADFVLVLTVPEPIGAGHHVEVGYAIGKGKRFVVAGPIKSVFHHMASHHYLDVEEAFMRIEEWT